MSRCTSQVLRQAMPRPCRHQSCSTWPSLQSSRPAGRMWVSAPSTTKAQPRVWLASDDNVRHS